MVDKRLERLRERKSKLVRYICLCEKYKSSIVGRDLNYIYVNRTVREWINYYNGLIAGYETKIREINTEVKEAEQRREAVKRHTATIGTVSAVILILMMVGLFTLFEGPAGITGMATQDTLVNVSVVNVAPNVTDVTITPASPDTDDNLSCSGTTSDKNLDTVTVYYGWFINGVRNDTFNTSNISSEYTTKGEEWICEITPYDGIVNGTPVNSSLVIIGNVAPNVTSAELYPATPYTTDNLTLNVTCSDKDGEDTLTAYWNVYRNNSLIAALGDSSVVPNGTETNITVVNSTNTSKHESWLLEVWCGDGTENSSKQNTSSRLIQNTLPGIPTLISPNDKNDTLFDRRVAFNWTNSTDADDDTISYELNITSETEPDVFKSGINDSNYTLQEDLEVDAWYNWSVRVYDGESYSNWSTIWSFYIPSTVIVNLTADSANFGNVYNNQAKNTTLGGNDDALPFIVENIGNVIADIKVKALDGLWDMVSLGTKYFQFMAGNYSDEPGSFNWIGSQITWQNMTNTTSLLVIDNLIYNVTNNSAEIEFNILVPASELSGSKDSAIVVSGVIS